MTEKQIEAYLRSRVEGMGGKCWKWTGTTGAPDRICLLATGNVLFVEVKTKGGRLSPIQQHVHAQMRALGHDVHVVWSKEDVDAILSL